MIGGRKTKDFPIRRCARRVLVPRCHSRAPFLTCQPILPIHISNRLHEVPTKWFPKGESWPRVISRTSH